jgi:hypothetical protein
MSKQNKNKTQNQTGTKFKMKTETKYAMKTKTQQQKPETKANPQTHAQPQNDMFREFQSSKQNLESHGIAFAQCQVAPVSLRPITRRSGNPEHNTGNPEHRRAF